MHIRHAITAFIASGALLQAASASVFFTFQDPSTPLEFHYTAGDGVNMGTITYDPAAVVSLKVDGTQDGFGVFSVDTRLVMDFTVGTASGVGGVFSAPTSGTFRFEVIGGAYDGTDILSGTMQEGALVSFVTAGALISTSSNGTLTLEAGQMLLDAMATVNLTELVPQFDASFSLADISPGVFGLNQFGYMTSFNANAAFVGNAVAIPSPGSAALGAIAIMLCMPQRRRPASIA
ncbi:MAG: hypothetical protein EA379_10845 [Phycisphaerales bacterium]|nr:MAG: hypothetical protein EA379_10845 [Phycisphaerales bacterium]